MQNLATRRWGVVFVLAGATLLGAEIALDFFGSENIADQSTADRISSLLFFMGALLLVASAIGLYQLHAEKLGRFGHVAFSAAIFGSVLMVSSDWTELFALPVMVDAGIEEPSGSLIAGFVLNYFSYSIGWLLAGIAIFRARLLPRGAAVSMIVGVIAVFFAGSGGGSLGQFLLWLMWYGAFIWMGLALLRGTVKRQNLRFAPVSAPQPG